MSPAIDEVRVELSLVDLPEATAHGLHAPTMRQSQDATVTVYNGLTLGTDALADLVVDPQRRRAAHTGLRVLLQAPVVWFTAELPVPTQTWMHEEWHRAALLTEGVHSRNGNSPRRWQGTVYDVTDEELAGVKEGDPAAWNRALSAGLESQVELSRRVTQEDFFLRDRSQMPALLLYEAWHHWNYLHLSAGEEADAVREWNLEHQGEELDRDFAGLDPVALARDLHRPDEAYAARGAHPSGEGLARPVAWSDLTEQEQDWLRRQRDLAWLNFANPMAFLLHHVSFGPEGGLQANAALHHRMTSFGSRTGLDLLLRHERVGVAAMVAVDRNLTGSPFGTLDLGLVRLPVEVGGLDLALSPRLVGWWQPQDLDPYATRGMPGVLASVRADARLHGRLSTFLQVEAKSRGEVSGTPSLDPAGAVRAGLTLDTAMAW